MRRFARVPGISVCVILFACPVGARAQLAPRPAIVKPVQTQVNPKFDRTDAIWIKFRDGLTIRMRNGTLNDLGTGSLQGAAKLLSGLAGAKWEPVHSLPETKLDTLRKSAEQRLSRSVADPNLEFFLYPPAGRDAASTIDAFNGLEIVEISLPVPLPMPAPTPPNFEPSQGYLSPATNGVDAQCMWTLAGGTGNRIKIADLEYSWNLNHQDLPSATLLGAAPIDPFNDTNHGTAVLGELASRRNGFGVTGIAHLAEIYVVATNTFAGYNPAGAITTALGTLHAGDVILIEQQTVGPNYTGVPQGTQFGLVPSEWDLPVYNAIVLAVGNGVSVVEAAGNGAQNLDDPIYSTGHGGHWPFLAGNDSGAIIVGAGAAPNGSDADRSRLSFSNYGSTVDLQGWGEQVVTSGYGDGYSAEGQNLWYTLHFSGTSSASPIVAGSVAMLQSTYKSQTGELLTPQQVKSFLQATGSKQQAGVHPTTENIGRRPNVAAAIAAAVPSFDGNHDGVPDCCEGGANHGAGCIPATAYWGITSLGILILIMGTLTLGKTVCSPNA